MKIPTKTATTMPPTKPPTTDPATRPVLLDVDPLFVFSAIMSNAGKK